MSVEEGNPLLFFHAYMNELRRALPLEDFVEMLKECNIELMNELRRTLPPAEFAVLLKECKSSEEDEKQ